MKNKKNMLNLILSLAVVTALFTPAILAGQNTCVELEVVFGGDLDAEWQEHSALEWSPHTDDDENYTYRWAATDYDVGFTISYNHSLNRVQNIYRTWVMDDDTWPGNIFLYQDDTDWYAVLMINGSAFIIYYNGTIYGWTGAAWDDNQINWYPYESEGIHPDVNITSVKTVFSRYTGHLLWKAWTAGITEDEPTDWVIDIIHPDF
ncbi:MAG: hypothetical protein ACTSPB_09230, partial [Candidatus Thorarchaeota archaeon]